jgi:hypothetical protein
MEAHKVQKLCSEDSLEKNCVAEYAHLQGIPTGSTFSEHDVGKKGKRTT